MIKLLFTGKLDTMISHNLVSGTIWVPIVCLK